MRWQPGVITASTVQEWKVGVLSNSVDYRVAVQATGGFPTVTILEYALSNNSEGTAMLEIAHDALQ